MKYTHVEIDGSKPATYYIPSESAVAKKIAKLLEESNILFAVTVKNSDVYIGRKVRMDSIGVTGILNGQNHSAQTGLHQVTIDSITHECVPSSRLIVYPA